LNEREASLPLLQLSTLDEGGEPAGIEPTREASLARQPMKQLLDDVIGALPPIYQSKGIWMKP
jgi:hypothetical protein